MEASYTVDLLFFLLQCFFWTIHLIAYFNNHGEVLKMFKGFFNEQTGLINIIYTQSQIFHKIQTKNGHSDMNFFLNKPIYHTQQTFAPC